LKDRVTNYFLTTLSEKKSIEGLSEIRHHHADTLSIRVSSRVILKVHTAVDRYLASSLPSTPRTNQSICILLIPLGRSRHGTALRVGFSLTAIT